MNVEPTQQPTTDDPELAKVLADNDNQQAQSTEDDASQSSLQFEETPMANDQAVPDDQQQMAPVDDAGLNNAINELSQVTPDQVAPEPAAEPAVAATAPAVAPAASAGGLDDIKKDALEELRPLVDKLTLPADEKFDIMRLIIRSTDDQSLVGAAHEAAKQIEDESKRAQALLDVVKEIDYFAGQSQQVA